MKKVLVIPHLFYPEVASTAQIYSELFHELENDFKITVLCSVPCYSGKIDEKYKKNDVYEEKYGNINVLRVKVKEFNKSSKISRVKHIISYYKNVKRQIKLMGHFDVTFVCSQPPIIGGILGRYSKKKNSSKFIYNIQDFNPEQAEAVMSKIFKPFFYFLKKVDSKSCTKADEVIVVGRDMLETLKKRTDNKTKKAISINNWIDEKMIYPLETHEKIDSFKNKYDLNDKFVFMYSGNIGLYYDLLNILKTINELPKNLATESGEKVEFVFVGAGSVLNEMIDFKNKNNMENVKFVPYQRKEDIIYSLNSADVHFVVNSKGIKGVSVPSKCYGVMGVGKPILGVLEKKSECEMIISEAKCGTCCEPGNYDEIKNSILWFVDNCKNIKQMGENGRRYLVDNYKKEISINKYRTEILDI